ncbi:hypothetical protein KQX54_017176 [Cotesia glomerata]|uniref:Uncharacterized protein n=1 Tax=Cotesia glomerata TaxID=32391 RepID=A0AAV7I3L6_COTGL|nr:hypothetical protein KQX54_017176 [Cotesia glomerata]
MATGMEIPDVLLFRPPLAQPSTLFTILVYHSGSLRGRLRCNAGMVSVRCNEVSSEKGVREGGIARRDWNKDVRWEVGSRDKWKKHDIFTSPSGWIWNFNLSAPGGSLPLPRTSSLSTSRAESSWSLAHLLIIV